jgi:glycerol transport system ATP-binding protein
MIYVTHDQTEALTFADKVVVMYEGEVVQIGTPEELFNEPAHTFVGYFIGSPGMNVIPCEIERQTAKSATSDRPSGRLRPRAAKRARHSTGIRLAVIGQERPSCADRCR